MRKLLHVALFALAGTALAGDPPKLYFIAPSDGDVIEGPVRVVFGLRGMGVAPAGVAREDTGHHHLVIDAELPPAGKPIPATENYRHFGGGQTEAVIELPPGRHTLQLVLGDHNHIPHEPPVFSEKITITVKEPADTAPEQ